MNAIPHCVATMPDAPLSTGIKLTFADLILQVQDSATLTDDQKRVLLSDLKVAAEMLSRLPAAVPCDGVWLNRHLFRQSAAAFGKSRNRFRNIKSSIRKALRLVGLHQPRLCDERDLTPDWIEMLDAVTFQPQRAGLRRLARFCAVRGIPRSALTNPVFQAFLEEDCATRLAASTTRRGAIVARAWNRAIADNASLGDCQPLQAPRQRDPYTLPIERFLESLQAEYAQFKEWLSPSQGKSLFKAKGSKHRARPGSVKTRSFAVLQMLAALVHLGHDPASITSFRHLVEYAGDILEFFEARALARLPPEQRENAEIVGGQLAVIADTLFIIGVHFLGLAGEAADRAPRDAQAGPPPTPQGRAHRQGPRAAAAPDPALQPQPPAPAARGRREGRPYGSTRPM